MKRIGVIGIEGRWSSEKMVDTIEQKTGFRSLLNMDQIVCDLARARVSHKGVDLRTLDAVIIKKISKSYAPDVNDRLELLAYLKSLGVPIFSDPEKILRMINRLSCTTMLRSGQIPIPQTAITENIHEALEIIHEYQQAVLKPIYTSKGKGMRVVQAKDGLKEMVEMFQRDGNPILYIQKLVPIQERDLGIVFVGGSYIGTYARVKQLDSWSTSSTYGGHYEAYEPSQEIIDLAAKAQALFGLDFTCVDLVETDEGPKVFEVSAFGGFRGLQESQHIDLSVIYLNHVLKKLSN